MEQLYSGIAPVRARGGGVESVSSVSPACRKRRQTGAVCRNHRIKSAWTGTLKNHTKCLWRLEPDRGCNYFFFSPPAHLCAVTCMTEILLIVTLNNQFTSPHIFRSCHDLYCLMPPNRKQHFSLCALY